jgi:hypothetical protein
MLLHVPKTGHVLLHASKVKRVPIPCGLQTAGNKALMAILKLKGVGYFFKDNSQGTVWHL